MILRKLTEYVDSSLFIIQKCKYTAMKYIMKGEVGKYYNSLVTCMKTCKKGKVSCK